MIRHTMSTVSNIRSEVLVAVLESDYVNCPPQGYL